MTETAAVTVDTVDSADSGIAARIWARDASLWLPADADAATVESVAGRLGWLDCIDWMQAESRAEDLQAWADDIIAGDEYNRVIVLGMGGSSLAAAVFAEAFDGADGLPVTVIDTTYPADITRLAGRNLRRCLFIVSSKSGDTVETVDLHAFFRARLEAQLKGTATADIDAHFVFITDRDSALHQAAGQSRVFINPSDIGGRFSALSYFGLAPAALAGADIRRLLTRAQEFAAATRMDDPRDNPALALGLQLGKAALAGRDKLILRLPLGWRAFGLWVEQLVAESTGKDGRGIVPVLAEEADGGSVNTVDPGGADCIRARIVDLDDGVDGDDGGGLDIDLQLRMDGGRQLGAEFFRWEFATAVAAHYLRVNPFDQPDVAQAKTRTAAFIRGGDEAAVGAFPGDGKPGLSPPTFRVVTGYYDLIIPVTDLAGDTTDSRCALPLLAGFVERLTPATYLAFLAYMPDDSGNAASLFGLRCDVAQYARVAATAGFGPRYLHSAGQLHKGGPAGGRLIQFLDYIESGEGAKEWKKADLRAPGRDYTFGQLLRAQADGDFAALAAAGRPVMRVEIKPPADEGLSDFNAALLVAMNAAAPASPNRPA